MFDVLIEEKTETEEEFEPLYNVIIHNDDVTTFEFVIIILQKIFGRNSLQAEHIALTAHINSIAYVVTLPQNEAQQLVGKAHFAATLEDFPLTFTIEPE